MRDIGSASLQSPPVRWPPPAGGQRRVAPRALRSGARPPTPDGEFEQQLLAVTPAIRAFARGLCRDATAGEDLAQETLLKAWAHRSQFCPGTNLRGWVYKIARNHYYSDRRKGWRGPQMHDDIATVLLVTPAGQTTAIELNDLRKALGELTNEQRQAVMLIGVGGYSHRGAAAVCGVAVGTMKSRLSRARARLAILAEGGGFRQDARPACQAMALLMRELSDLMGPLRPGVSL